MGKGYDVLSDQITTFDIFELGKTRNEMGFEIPEGFRLSRINQKERFEYHFEDVVSFAQERLNQLGLGGQVNPKILTIKARAGFSRSVTKNEKSSNIEKSYFYESRPLKMSIANLDKLTHNAGFRKEIESRSFPSEYVESDLKKRDEMLQFFKGFFNKWGHYIVTSAFVGGSVELKSSCIDSNSQASSTSGSNFGLGLGFYKLSSGIDYTSDSSSARNLGVSFSSVKLNWDGGDPRFQVSNLDEASAEKWNSWEESLNDCPSVLTTRLQLLPISDIVKLIEEEKGAVCQKVMNELIGKEIPKLRPNDPTKQKERAVEQLSATRQQAAHFAKPKAKKSRRCTIS